MPRLSMGPCTLLSVELRLSSFAVKLSRQLANALSLVRRQLRRWSWLRLLLLTWAKEG
ncbi:hypothetical protein ACVI1I_006266 [Bradyrhizobium sp. USDA 4459]